jgi:hypothetical protein
MIPNVCFEKNIMSKTITFSKRLVIGIIAISFCAVLVGATILSNYIVPSTVNVTSQPGIVVVTGDIPTSTCTTTAVTTFALGDVQQSQSKNFATICIRNSQGSATQYILPQSLTTQAPLPSGLTLTWTNFPSAAINCGTVTTNCIAISPSQSTPPLSLTFSVSSTAAPGSVSFTVQFNAYSTNTG